LNTAVVRVDIYVLPLVSIRRRDDRLLTGSTDGPESSLSLLLSPPLEPTTSSPSEPLDVNIRLSAISNLSSAVQRVNKAGQICSMEIGEWLHDHLSSFNPDIFCNAKLKYLSCFLCIPNSSSVDSKSVSRLVIPQGTTIPRGMIAVDADLLSSTISNLLTFLANE
jgi:hypothetical protein